MAGIGGKMVLLSENGHENTPFVRKIGGFLPAKTGKSAPKIALRQRRSVFLRSKSVNFPFRWTKQRLFDSKTGDFVASLDERGNIPTISKVHIAGQIPKNSGQNTNNCGNFLCFVFSDAVLNLFGRRFPCFRCKKELFCVPKSMIFAKRVDFLQCITAERVAMVSKSARNGE